PVTGVNLTLLVMGGSQPTVTSNGQTLSGSSISNGYSYQIPTNAAGQATAQLAVPSGVAASYTLQYQAPYTQSGSSITDSAAYLTFMNAYSMAITPFATSSSPYMTAVSSVSNEAAGAVPVTVTLPLLNGQPQANAQVSFVLTGGAGAFFSNAQGQTFSSSGTATVNTDSQGQATVYVNSDQTSTSGSPSVVTATSGSLSPVSTYITWGQTGVASSVANLSATNVTSGSGSSSSVWQASNNTNVTVTGTLQDALGNPVANAQLLVSSNDVGSYVNGTTTTAFPNAVPASGALVSSTGAPYGTVVTTNSSGAFSVTLTGSGAAGQFSLWTVQNGEVGSQLGSPIYITYAGSSSSISSVGVSTNNQQALSFTNNAGPVTTLPSTQYNVISGGNLEIAAYNSLPGDYLYGNPNASVSYTVTGTSGGDITSIDGVSMGGSGGMPNDPTSVTVTLQPTKTASATQTNQVYNVLVNNVSIGTESVTYTFNSSGVPTAAAISSPGTAVKLPSATSVDSFTQPSDLGNSLGSSGGPLIDAVNVGVNSTSTGTANFTFTSNSAKATAAPTFTGGAPVKVATLSPQASSINPGQTETVTFTLEDANGNPVPNSLATLTSDGSNSDLWVTQVNGQTLQQNESVGTTYTAMPTPFPLFPLTSTTLPSVDTLGYTSVNVPGVAYGNVPSTGTPGSKFNVYTNSKGQFTLTFAAGSVSAYVTQSVNGSPVGQAQPAITAMPSNSLTANFLTNSKGYLTTVANSVYTDVYVTSNSSSPVQVNTTTGNTNVGTLQW
ncbi:MAG: beta strand repeat-containing protein, partial [Bacilli bacterium]